MLFCLFIGLVEVLAIGQCSKQSSQITLVHATLLFSLAAELAYMYGLYGRVLYSISSTVRMVSLV